MNIGLFTDSYLPQTNGVATSVGYLAKSLRNAGHSISIIAPKIRGYKDTKEDIMRIPSMRIWPTMPDVVRTPLPFPDKVWIKLLSRNYSLIHAHGNGLFSLVGYAVAKRRGIPFILTFHTLLSEYTHYFMKGKVITNHTMNRILKLFGNLSDGITTPSDKMRTQLIALGIRKPIVVIPNFIDVSSFSVKNTGFLHASCHLTSDVPLILSVGRLGKEKNFSFALESFSLLAQKEKTSHFVIVGEGVEKKRLQRQAQQLGIEKRVHFPGGITYAQMPYVYADASLFFFPSVTEVHPMVVIEAAASGLPLILANDKAYENEIVHGKNGYVVPLKPKLFAQKLLYLLENPKIRSAFGAYSRELIAKRYDEKKFLSQILSFYTQVLQQRNKKQLQTHPQTSG